MEPYQNVNGRDAFDVPVLSGLQELVTGHVRDLKVSSTARRPIYYPENRPNLIYQLEWAGGNAWIDHDVNIMLCIEILIVDGCSFSLIDLSDPEALDKAAKVIKNVRNSRR